MRKPQPAATVVCAECGAVHPAGAPEHLHPDAVVPLEGAVTRFGPALDYSPWGRRAIERHSGHGYIWWDADGWSDR